MGIGEAIILGVVQGLTEFLPISSSGHLILAREVFGFSTEGGLAFDAVLHFATSLAVVAYFWKDILQLLKVAGKIAWRTFGHGLAMVASLPVATKGENSALDSIAPPTDQKERRMLVALIVATIPAAILGILLEDILATTFRSALLVAGALIAGSIIMLIAERFYHVKENENEVLTTSRALTIGFFQSLALIPGMSRSGMAISGGMLMGLSRTEAARFAFLLAVPLLLGAGAKKLVDLGASGELTELLLPIVLGALAAFVTGAIAIHVLLAIVRRYSLRGFVAYRLLLAAVVIVLAVI